MGCDIHAAIEVRQSDGTWKAVLSPNKYHGQWEGEEKLTASVDIGRNYDLFAILGNVRNGVGFAGIDTGDGFSYISDSRGVPDDISPEASKALSEEHSASWVTLRELLEFDWSQTTKKRGMVNQVEFEHWDRVKEWEPRPREWCGDVSGPKVKHVDIGEMRKLVKRVVGNKRGAEYSSAVALLEETPTQLYCRIEWEENYAEAAGKFYTHIIPQMKRLGTPDDVRLVFDFDS